MEKSVSRWFGPPASIGQTGWDGSPIDRAAHRAAAKLRDRCKDTQRMSGFLPNSCRIILHVQTLVRISARTTPMNAARCLLLLIIAANTGCLAHQLARDGT